jgi:hypothetical protein
MYNDISREKNVILNSKHFDDNTTYEIDISGNARCVCCGNIIYDEDHETSSVACYECGGCDPRIYCSCCDRRIYEDETCWYEGEPYCESCWNDEFGMCDLCGEFYDYDSLSTVAIIDSTAKEDDLISRHINNCGEVQACNSCICHHRETPTVLGLIKFEDPSDSLSEAWNYLDISTASAGFPRLMRHILRRAGCGENYIEDIANIINCETYEQKINYLGDKYVNMKEMEVIPIDLSTIKSDCHMTGATLKTGPNYQISDELVNNINDAVVASFDTLSGAFKAFTSQAEATISGTAKGTIWDVLSDIIMDTIPEPCRNNGGNN